LQNTGIDSRVTGIGESSDMNRKHIRGRLQSDSPAPRIDIGTNSGRLTQRCSIRDISPMSTEGAQVSKQSSDTAVL
jgi:hypothetical protein